MIKLEIPAQGKYGRVKHLVKECGVFSVGIGQQEGSDGFSPGEGKNNWLQKGLEWRDF